MIFRLFPGKIKEKFFQKMQKTLLLAYFGPILPIFAQNRIFLEILFLPVFLILTKYHCAKFKKNNNKKNKLMSGFLATLVSDGCTDGQA